jgi:glycosyltransferase involved in cell wall biosynthesis
MRVLIVTDWNRGQGGAEAYIGWLRSGLKEAGDEVRLLTSSAGSAADGTAEYVAYGTEQVAAQVFLQIANPFAVRTIRRAVREFRPEVAFVNMFAHHLSPAIFHALGDIPAVLAVSDYKCVCPIGSKLRPDNSVCTSPAGWVCHQAGCVNLAHWIRDQPRYALIRSAVGRATRVIACSKSVLRELERAGIEAECVYLPVPGPGITYTKSPAAEPRILFNGRLDREKGVEQLLQAFARVSVASPRATLRIAGRGPLRDQLEALAHELGVGRQVTFLGWQEPAQIEREIAEAWVVAAPSLWPEPLGLVALEAMVRGVPVIASAVGGFSEIVEHGVSGMLVNNGDVVALAEGLIAILDGRHFASGLPEDVVRRVSDRHDLTRHIALMRSTFTEIVAA